MIPSEMTFVDMGEPDEKTEPPFTLSLHEDHKLTLRDHFALQFIHAIARKESLIMWDGMASFDLTFPPADLAQMAYKYADGMLAERSKNE